MKSQIMIHKNEKNFFNIVNFWQNIVKMKQVEKKIFSFIKKEKKPILEVM